MIVRIVLCSCFPVVSKIRDIKSLLDVQLKTL